MCVFLILNVHKGEPSCQKTIALEKASILFNIAALYTQIGAKTDRTKVEELNNAVDCFLKASGIFQHIIGDETQAFFLFLPLSNITEVFGLNFFMHLKMTFCGYKNAYLLCHLSQTAEFLKKISV